MRPADDTRWSAYYGNSSTYPCGHPRTPENSQKVGILNGVRCKICRREILARSRLKKARAVA